MKRRFVMLTMVAAFLMQASAVMAQGVFSGDWEVSRADNAPWLAARPELKPANEAFLRKAHFSFKAGQLLAPSWMGCKKPKYEMMSLNYDALFEGGLYDPDHGLKNARELAQKLGFTAEPVVTMQSSCSEILFHLLNQDTALFGLNNMIYTLNRISVKK